MALLPVNVRYSFTNFSGKLKLKSGLLFNVINNNKAEAVNKCFKFYRFVVCR